MVPYFSLLILSWSLVPSSSGNRHMKLQWSFVLLRGNRVLPFQLLLLDLLPEWLLRPSRFLKPQCMLLLKDI
jgi:hypothetical protein